MISLLSKSIALFLLRKDIISSDNIEIYEIKDNEKSSKEPFEA